MAPKASKTVGGALRIFGLAVLATAQLSHAKSFSTECATQSETCVEDDTCIECFEILEAGVRKPGCQDSYDTEDATFCERVGASHCCLFEDEDAVSTCLSNGPTFEFWGCILEGVGCSLDDLPCYGHEDSSSDGSDGTTPAPVAGGTDDGDDGATRSPVSGETDDESATPAPVDEGTGDGGDDTTPSPFAVGDGSVTPSPVDAGTSDGGGSATPSPGAVGDGSATPAPVTVGRGGVTTSPAGDTTEDSSTGGGDGSSATDATDVPATTSSASASDTTATDPPEEPTGRELDTPSPTLTGSAGEAGTPSPTSISSAGGAGTPAPSSTGSAGGSPGGATPAPVASSRDIVVSPSSSSTSATSSLSDEGAGSGAGEVTPAPTSIGDDADEEVDSTANVAAAGIVPASGVAYAGVLGLGVLLATRMVVA